MERKQAFCLKIRRNCCSRLVLLALVLLQMLASCLSWWNEAISMHLWNTCDNTNHHTPTVHAWTAMFFPPVIVAKPMAFTISQSSFSIYPRPFAWLQLYSFAQIWWASLKHVWLMQKTWKDFFMWGGALRLFIWNLKSLKFYSMKSLVKSWRCVPIRIAFCPLSERICQDREWVMQANGRERERERKWKLERAERKSSLL